MGYGSLEQEDGLGNKGWLCEKDFRDLQIK